MASSNLALLQRTANRFASVAGFAPIAADGGMGSLTENAVKKAINHAADPGFFTAMSMNDSTLGAARGLSDELKASSSPATTIMQRNVELNTVLTQAANELGLPAASAPSGGVPLNPVTGNAVATTPTVPAAGGAAGSILGVFGTMPMPMKLALAGITVGIGYFAFFASPKKKRK